jgi:phosphoglycerate kinase
MQYKTIDDIEVTGKRVFLRVDFNVPLTKTELFTITDDTRIRAALPTIVSLVSRGARLIIASHLGRPKGAPALQYSLVPVKARLGELLGLPIQWSSDCIGAEVAQKANALKNGEVLLLENLRFHKEEEANDPAFAQQLASLAEVYVDDAFGAAHRAHASIEGITHFLNIKAAGYLMDKEVKYLGSALDNPNRPFVSIIGGAKISGKIDVIECLLTKADFVVIGGGMMFTFYKAMGYEIGNSLLEPDKVDVAKDLLKRSEAGKVKLILPVDTIVAKSFSNDAEHKTVDANAIEPGWTGMDIGPKSIELFANEISRAELILWNGPMGVFEMPNFAQGTFAIAQAMAAATARGATTIVGGGDSVAAVEQCKLTDRMTHVSTGGGASLEFFEGKTLPGVAALSS